MRLVSYQGQDEPRAAGVRDGGYVDLNATDSRIPACLRRLLKLGDEGLDWARRATEQGPTIPSDSVRVLAPIPAPQKVICIGLNYADHAAETGAEVPTEPIVFNKFPSAIAAHGDSIVLPEHSQQVDYEAELVVIIGRRGRHIPQENAFDFVAGYACGHDVSARDWQLRKPGGQWLLGKSFDTFAPFGPELVTPEEVGNCGDLGITLRVNGQTMQSSNTRQLIFPIDHLISYISDVCTLQPGDVIFTGTPPGVGMAQKPPVFLQADDVVEVEIENVGLLRNTVVAA